MMVIRHVLAIALAVAMLFMGAQKFGADNFIFATIAQKSGFAFFEPGFRMFSGVLEVLAGLLMFHPASRASGSVLASGIVSGAVVFHLSPWLATKVAMAADSEASYALFTMALVYLVLALINLYLNRKSIPFVGRHLG